MGSELKNMMGSTTFAGGNAKYIRICEVVRVDPLLSISNDEVQGRRDTRYNADPHIIRVKVLGNNSDKDDGQDLPNAYPLLPKHLSVIPKLGEYVLVFFLSEDTTKSERYYVGPLTSNLTKLDKDATIDSLAGLSIGPTEGVKNINQLPNIKGVYSDGKDITINGRDNADISFKSGEVRIRAGKFVKGKPDTFNAVNPAYFQIRYNVALEKGENNTETKRGSVANIVANKVNILGFNDTDYNFTLTDREKLITDDELLKIIEDAQPVVFGRPLLDYLQKLENFALNHVHAGNGLLPVTLDNNETRRKVYVFPKESLLSKNVRIN